MEVSKAEDNLSCIEASPILSEPNLVAQVEEKLSAIQKVGHEVQALVRLKGVVEFDHEGVRDLLHDITLNLHLISLVRAYDKVFLEGFYSVDLIARLFLGQVNLAK